ncbi:hypothetical protein L1987_49835 [Smallanthus sonchifolius]|uniref:Uncharacterized protein n=1 Tax=Smallanthus sonchifolius TaxID=185202 RepID=A0ACB9FVT7_9ASTR|nr:hypothetical protein L1987_49835 [Smallanthus sonchifolius]
MDWNLNASSEWGWEIEIPKSLANSSDENGQYSFSGFLDSSGKDRGGFSGMIEEGSVLSGEAMTGLKLGRQTECREKSRANAFPSVPDSSYSPVKRSRASHQSSVLPRCQVEGCNLDLASAKDYHRRHRICADHSKSPKVVVAGLERRFCQQCSRQVWLHDLSEFDDRKRSCRRRLSAHNARRRRPQSEDNKLGSGLTHRRSHMGFLVNRVSMSSTNSTPQSSSNFKGGCAADMMSNGGLSDISLCFHGIAPRRVNHDGLEANSSSITAMEVHHSFSLDAASSWGVRGHEEPSSFDQFIHGHNINLMQPGMPLEIQNFHRLFVGVKPTNDSNIPPHTYLHHYRNRQSEIQNPNYNLVFG